MDKYEIEPKNIIGLLLIFRGITSIPTHYYSLQIYYIYTSEICRLQKNLNSSFVVLELLITTPTFFTKYCFPNSYCSRIFHYSFKYLYFIFLFFQSLYFKKKYITKMSLFEQFNDLYAVILKQIAHIILIIFLCV